MLRSWWIQSGLPALESAETRLLALTGVKRYDVPVGNGLHIHTLEGGQNKHVEGKPPLILLHGYGQGAAAFFLNLPQLTENVSHSVHAYTCLCMHSSRNANSCAYTNASASQPHCCLIDSILALLLCAWADHIHIAMYVIANHCLCYNVYMMHSCMYTLRTGWAMELAQGLSLVQLVLVRFMYIF
jgi:hypothetical protein